MGGKPIKQFKAGALSVTIWNNVDVDRNGNTIAYSTISLQRNYKAKDGWKSTSSMRLNDLPKAALLLEKAYEFLVYQENRTSFVQTSEKQAAVS